MQLELELHHYRQSLEVETESTGHKNKQEDGDAVGPELDHRLAREVDLLLRTRLAHKVNHRFDLADHLENEIYNKLIASVQTDVDKYNSMFC